MAQVLLYSRKQNFAGRRTTFSDTLHSCLCDALALPAEKRFHRFIALEEEDFVHPVDRTAQYTIIEIHLFSGRTTDTKKNLLRLIFERFQRDLGIAPQDVEITLIESPKENWGIRGKPGDELALSYKIDK
jgi:phenylpyruvate tautomerase PptA (4-oxalocrotonate tautomerase family)